MRISKGKNGRKNFFALIAYSTFPAIFFLFFVVPIQLGSFGMFLFTNNPPPKVLNESVFWAVKGLEGIFLVYYLVMNYMSVKVLMPNNTLNTLVYYVIYHAISFLLILFIFNYIELKQV